MYVAANMVKRDTIISLKSTVNWLIYFLEIILTQTIL